MLGSPLPLQSQGWHELPSTRGFPKKPGVHLAGRDQWLVLAGNAASPGPRTQTPPQSGTRPPSSPLAGGPGVAGFAETLGAATSQDAARGEAAETEAAVTPSTLQVSTR